MDNPLSKNDLAALQKAIYVLSEAEQEIEKARMAGIDVSEHEARQRHLKEALQAIHRVYGDHKAKQ